MAYCTNLLKNLTVRGLIENRTPLRGKEAPLIKKVYELGYDPGKAGLIKRGGDGKDLGFSPQNYSPQDFYYQIAFQQTVFHTRRWVEEPVV